MKFNYKKIASVLASAVMLSSTVGLAAAATYPAPFTSGGAIVYGVNAASTDMAAAVDVYASLKTQTTTSSSGSTTITGEAQAIETSGQKLYLGDFMNTTKTAFTKTEMPTVLADGKITDDGGTSYDYNLKINTPNTETKYGKTTDNLAVPVLYVDLETSSEQYSTEINFPTAINVTKLTNKEITLFGKKFTFSGSQADLTTSTLVLFENAQSKTIASGESVDVEVGGTTYTVAVTSVESSTGASITVNGVSQAVTEGSSYKVSGLDVYVKNVNGPSVAGETRSVELYIGSAKMTLTSGSAVTKGSDTIYGTTATLTTAGTGKLSKISIAVKPASLDKRVRYLKLGDVMTDPIYGSFKLSFGSVEPALDDSSKDEIVIKASGEQKGRLSFTNKNGNKYDVELFKPTSYCVTSGGMSNQTLSGACTTAYPNNASMLGFDTYKVVTTNARVGGDGLEQIKENDYVITQGNTQYSQIWQVTTIDVNTQKVTFRDMATGGSSQTISAGTSSTSGLFTGTLTLGDSSSVTVNISGNGTTAGTLNVSLLTGATPILYTKNGAKIDLTQLANATSGDWNCSGVAGCGSNGAGNKIAITEETSYNDGDFKLNDGTTTVGGKAMNISLNWLTGQSGNDLNIRGVTIPESDSGTSGDYDTYYVTKYGSFIKYTGQTDKIFTMYYPKVAAAMKVYIGEESSSITPGTTGTGSSGTISLVKDTEVDSVSDLNLFVVGGSCINEVAAKILGSDTPVCGADFSDLTDVSAGGYIIKVIASPYNEDKIAMLVAGYNAADTQAAVTKAMTGVTTDVGTVEKYPIVATTA